MENTNNNNNRVRKYDLIEGAIFKRLLKERIVLKIQDYAGTAFSMEMKKKVLAYVKCDDISGMSQSFR